MSSLARSNYLLVFSFSLIFTLWSAGTVKPTIWQVLFRCWLSLGLFFRLGLGDLFVNQIITDLVCVIYQEGFCFACKTFDVIIIIIPFWDDGLPLKFKWQQVSASLHKSPGVFLVFISILIMLLFGWSPLVLLFPSPLLALLILWRLYRAHYLRFVLPSLSCFIDIFSSQARSLYLSFRYFQFYQVLYQNIKVHYSGSSLFCWLSLDQVVWLKLGAPILIHSFIYLYFYLTNLLV